MDCTKGVQSGAAPPHAHGELSDGIALAKLAIMRTFSRAFPLVLATLALVALHVPATGCAPSEETVGHRGNGKDDGSDGFRGAPRDLGDLPAQGDEGTTADDLCLDGCIGEEPGYDETGAGGGELAGGEAAGEGGDGVPGPDDEEGVSPPPPPVVLPEIQENPSTPGGPTAKGPAFTAPPVFPAKVPVECIGGPGLKAPDTKCAKAMGEAYPTECKTGWPQLCVSRMSFETACDEVRPKCPVPCSPKPDKAVGKPATLNAPMRFDLTPVPSANQCDYPVAFTAALYDEPHFIAVTKTYVGPAGLPIRSVQQDVWSQQGVDVAVHLYTLTEPFWDLPKDEPVARRRLRDGATYANCVVARLESSGNTRAGKSSAGYCKDILPDHVITRSASTASLTRLLGYSIEASQWDAPGEGGRLFRQFLIDFATRLDSVYGIRVVFVVGKAAPTGFDADWKRLSDVAWLAPSVFAHTPAMAHEADKDARKKIARQRYDVAMTKWTAAGVPQNKLLVTEHFGDYEAPYNYERCEKAECDKAGDNCKTRKSASGKPFYRCQKRVTWGRAGMSASDWEHVMRARFEAAAGAGFVGTVSMGWSSPLFTNEGLTYDGDGREKKASRRRDFERDAYGKFKRDK